MPAFRIIITGLVQGVGFRPFIDRSVKSLGLKGYVRNIGGSEVEIWIEGGEDSLYEFLYSLYVNRPPPAIIEDVFLSIEEPQGFKEFTILRSDENAVLRSNIPPDLAMCRECLSEILDPHNRRYRYPFNSCAWCGPRYSMLYKIPYDRENTAMAKYRLCQFCEKEYGDPSDHRRYHAQGISCPHDGPRLLLVDKDFEEITCKDPIAEAAKLIDEGFIVGVKGIGGYHIATLATNDEVVLRLRERKRRPNKPFAIMGLDTNVLKQLVYMDERDEEILNSPQAPILLLPKHPDSPVSKYVSPDLSHEGVFIAYTPLHYLLLMSTRDKFLIMTSGNISGEPMCIDEECAKKRLSKIADYFLIHDREIVNRVDDSVLRRTGDEYVFLRRSRGYAPMWIRITRELTGTYLALGSDTNNACAIGFEDKVVLTPHIGDLDNVATQIDAIKYIDFLLNNYKMISEGKPVIVVDKHPGYISRMIGLKYADKLGSKVMEIQHHYAHVLGVAIDNGVDGKVIGLAIDGLGWGDDNTIWGGEVIFLETSKPGYKRVASIDPLPLTGERDINKPLRLVYGYLSHRGLEIGEINRLLRLNPDNKLMKELSMTCSLVKNGKFIPASSTGRLIDMISAIINPYVERTYEGEPAIKLEAMAHQGREVFIDDYKFRSMNGKLMLEYHGIIQWIIENLDKNDKSTLARSFLYTLGFALGELIMKVIRGLRIDHVVISGGVSVNEFIYRGVSKALTSNGIKPLLPRKIPPGDGGLALGQIVAASLLETDK
ncbi:MAG: carbamoyltransferase HypF [Desulfurococcaceae archaeon]